MKVRDGLQPAVACREDEWATALQASIKGPTIERLSEKSDRLHRAIIWAGDFLDGMNTMCPQHEGLHRVAGNSVAV